MSMTIVSVTSLSRLREGQAAMLLDSIDKKIVDAESLALPSAGGSESEPEVEPRLVVEPEGEPDSDQGPEKIDELLRCQRFAQRDRQLHREKFVDSSELAAAAETKVKGRFLLDCIPFAQIKAAVQGCMPCSHFKFDLSWWEQRPCLSSISFQPDSCLAVDFRTQLLARALRAHDGDKEKPSVMPAVELDVGFAQCTVSENKWLSEIEAENPSYEFYIKAIDLDSNEDGISAILALLGDVLARPEIESGFVLTYDLTGLYGPPQFDLIAELARWAQEPCRKVAFAGCCKSMRIVVPEGAYFDFARHTLSALFYFDPPICRTYLVSDGDDPCVPTQTECYDPEVLVSPQSVNKPDNVASAQEEDSFEQFLSMVAEATIFAPVHILDMGASALYTNDGSVQPEPHRQAAEDQTQACKAPDSSRPCGQEDNKKDNIVLAMPTEQGRMPTSLDVGFTSICQGFDNEKGLGYLRITGADNDFSEKGLADVMAFMDAFVNSDNAAHGFSITYDMRQMRTPSVNMVMAVAEWGNEPIRQEKWERLNLVCKVVIESGLKFSFCKGILSSFFFVCPPVCRTFLLTDPDEPEEHAVVFEPPAKSIRQQLPSAASGVAGE